MSTAQITRSIACAVAITAVTCGTAQAAPIRRHEPRAGLIGTTRAYGRATHRRSPQHPWRPVATATASSAWAPTPSTPALGVGGGVADDCAMNSSDAQYVRVILYRDEPQDTDLQCAENAVDAGRGLLVSIQYNPTWPTTQIEAWFRSALAIYAPLHPYAISVGNEQELVATEVGESGDTAAAYSDVWKRVEPIIAQEDPTALRVAGEISPWGLNWFAQAAADGLPGAQVYAAHPYPDSNSPWAGNPIPFAELAAGHGVQAWATEGMCGPHSWMQYGCLRESTLAADGFQVGIDWEAVS